VGGEFDSAGGVPVGSIARWDGSSWSALGDSQDASGIVESMTVHDDGRGPALYVGGATIAGFAGNQVGRWDGAQWESLQVPGVGDPDGRIIAMQSFDDGGGPMLYAGGRVTTTGAEPSDASALVRWDGEEWTSVDAGLEDDVRPIVWDMSIFNDGSGPALYIAGQFDSASGVPASNIVRWDGQNWQALDSGTNGTVSTLLEVQTDAGRALYASGEFSVAGGQSAFRIGQWKGCPVLTISVMPASLAFEEQPLNTPSPTQMVVVENTGEADLQFNAIEFDGPAAGDFQINLSECQVGQPLAPGAFCGIDVLFNPLSEGIRQAQLVIDSNSRDGIEQVSLQGTSGVVFFDDFEAVSN